MSQSERRAAFLAISYFLTYVPFAYFIRGAGAAHGGLEVLPVYSVACAVTLAVAMVIFRKHLPRWQFSRRAWLAGGASAVVMYASSAAYMNKAPPILTAVVMKIGTLFMAAVLDYLALPRRRPLMFPLALAALSVIAGWSAQGIGSLLFSVATAVYAVMYVVGWTGKLWASAANKGDPAFGVAEQVATAVCSVGAGLVLVLVESFSSGFPTAAWTDSRVWVAGFFSQLTGMLATALVLFPASHSVCMAASRGASLAAGVVAQLARDRHVGGLELVSAFFAGWASTAAVKRSAPHDRR